MFGEWTAYNRGAFLAPLRRQIHLSNHDNTRITSRGSLIHISKVRNRTESRSSSTSFNESGKAEEDARPVPKSHKKMNRWKDAVSEISLHLQAARVKLPQTIPKSDLRLYVSSTPDVQEEREFLEEVAYHKIQELCEKLGVNCHVIDMRNGSGTLANDLETFNIIEQELHECRRLSLGPYFVSIIGHVLDDQRLPGFMHKSVYEEIRQTLIRENISGLDAFDDVYRLDSNHVPPMYVKQPIHTVEEHQTPEEVEQILYNALCLAISVISKHKGTDTGVDFYKWSAVVKEIEEGLFTSYTPRSNTLCFMMDLNEVKDAPKETMTPIQHLRHNVVQHYKNFARVDNIFNIRSGKKSVAYLRSISDNFVSGVSSLLKAQIKYQKYNITQMFTEGSEAMQHVCIALHEAENNSGNENILSSIKDIVKRSDTAPKVILLWGQSGTGKTAIVSQVAKASAQWQPKQKVVFRCLGATLRSSSLFRVLESLFKQLNFLYSLDLELPADVSLQQTVLLFCRMLNAISVKQEFHGDLLLILDQLERLPDIEAHHLQCILNSLSVGTTLILTLQTPHLLFNHLESHPNVQAISRLYISENEVIKHIKENLDGINRVLNDDQYETALHILPSDITPMHGQMLLHLSRWWPSHTLPNPNMFSERLDLNFFIFLEMIEMEVGKAFTQYALSFLALARHGLAGQEILHLLSTDSDLLNEIKEEDQESVSVVDGFPYQYHISQLISRLGKFVISLKLEGETVYQITAKPLVDAIVSKYLSDGFFFIVHFRLANFFIFIRRGLLLSSKDISEQKHKHLSKYHWRTFRCVPYHLCHSSADTAHVWAQLKEKVFFNFTWLVNEVYSGYVNDLMEDINYALENVSLDPDVQYLQKLLTSVRCTIIHNPLSFAAVLASQNVEDSHNVKDSIRAVVHEARTWLKQVHLQVLVPVSYTPGKDNRLVINESSIFNVTYLNPIPGTDTLLILRKLALSTFNMLTCESVPIATFNSNVISIHLPDKESVIALILDVSSRYIVEVFSLSTGKHVRSIALGSSQVLWFDVRSAKAAYFAINSSIKFVDLERGSVKNIFTTKYEWSSSCLSSSKPEKLLTVTVGEKTKIEATSMKDITEANSAMLKNEPQNQYSIPLLSTRDGRYIIYVTERQAVIIEQSVFKVTDTYIHNGLPIVKAELSRSHEHVFLAHVNGIITCHVLLSGKLSMVARTKPKEQWMTSSAVQDRAQNRNTGTTQKDDIEEVISELVTTEDDHFLFCGTNSGHVYVFHVPTGLQLVDITTQQKSITKIAYLTSKGNFQHLITMDTTGMARHWNLRPLMKQARMILQNYITDKDLLKEEETKLDLNKYYTVYETKRNNRIFLNGPDIAAFYRVPVTEIFADLIHLDPAFDVQSNWETTGALADICDDLIALTCGNELGGFILTASRDFRLAKWNLHDGSLMWIRRLPCQGGEILDIGSVYYDQAVLLVEKSAARFGCRVSVIYTGESKNKIMSRDDVTQYWTSLDRTRILLMCQDFAQSTDTSLYLWNLVNMNEEKLEFKHTLPSLHCEAGCSAFTCFSPNLQRCVYVVTKEGENLKMQTAWPHKYTSIKQQKLNLHLASGSDFENAEAGSVDTFDACDNGRQSSLGNRHSVLSRNTYESISPPRSADLWKNDPHAASNSQDMSSSRPGSGKHAEGDIIAKPLNASSEKSFPINSKTRLYWTEVSASSISSENLKEELSGTQNNQKMHILSDRGTPLSGSRSTSTFSRHKAHDKGQHIIEMDLKNKEQANIKEKEEDIPVAVIPLQVTTLCYVGEQDILLGTNSGHLLMISLPVCHQIRVLSHDGPILTNEVTETFLQNISTPHKDAIIYIAVSEDLKVIITTDQAMVCLWNVQNQTLIMKIELSKNEEISHLVVAKDAVIIAMVTNDRTIRLWTPIGFREVASYMTTFDIIDLQMTCDCRKVIVRGTGHENKQILEIFDILNVDDILMHKTDRKESQQLERRENLARERKTNRQQIQKLQKSPTLQVIEENEKKEA